MKPTESIDQQRKELVGRMLDPNLDLAGIRKVRKEALEWLKIHPDDPEILGNGENLVMREWGFVETEKANL